MDFENYEQWTKHIMSKITHTTADHDNKNGDALVWATLHLAETIKEIGQAIIKEIRKEAAYDALISDYPLDGEQ